MNDVRWHRRLPRVALLLVLVMAMMPFGSGVIAAPNTGNQHLSDITFKLVTTATVDEGEWWETETTFDLRGSVTEEAVSGDITGTALITMNGSMNFPNGCDDDGCPATIDSWSDIAITDENGTWDGQLSFQIDEIDDTEIGKIFLIGRGGNAGKAIYGDMAFLDDEDGAAEVTGTVATLNKPAQGVRFHYDGCFLPPADTAGHVRITAGTSTDSGDWHATYPLLIPGYSTFGESSISTAKGTIDSVLMLRSIETNRVGYFMLLGGTGEYENLYGFGIVRTAAYDNPYCDDGNGAGGHWIGRAYAN